MTEEDIKIKLKQERKRRINAELKLVRIKSRRARRARLFDSFMKILVGIIVLHGLGCVTASYVFAWNGVMEPMQSLSETIAREIVAPVVVYGVTKTIENVSKYNDWLDKALDAKYMAIGNEGSYCEEEAINNDGSDSGDSNEGSESEGENSNEGYESTSG